MPEWLSGEAARTVAYLSGLGALSWIVYGVARWGLVAAVRRAAARSSNT